MIDVKTTKELNMSNMEYKIVNSVDDLPSFSDKYPIFSDIESGGLYIDVRMIQLYQPQTSDLVYIVDLAPMNYVESIYEKELQKLKDWLLDKHTVWYNSSYDLGTLNISPSLGLVFIDNNPEYEYTHLVDDLYYIMKIAYAEFAKDGFGLKKIVKKFPETRRLYDNTKTDHGKDSFPKGAYISSSAIEYACADVVALSLLWELPKVRNVLANNLAYKVDMISQAYALVYQQNGLLLNREKWLEELTKAKADVNKYTSLLPGYDKNTNTFSFNISTPMNPNSFKQVRAFLETDKSDHDALVAYSMSDKPKAKYAEYIINLKKAKKQVSYLESINYDKMFTKFNVYGAVSGRFTATGGQLVNGFNAQQIPRNYQYLFNSPTEDSTVIHADYSTLELRLACAIFGSERMYKQLKDGKDLHTEMAIQATGKKLHPDGILGWDSDSKEYITALDRQKAKGINFGFVFGMSAKSYVPFAFSNYGITTTLEEAEVIRNKYFRLYPEFAVYHSNVWRNYKKPNFFVYTALGRKIKPNLGTDGINIPIQGSGAETTKLAVHYLVKDNPDYDMLSYIYNVVHDAIYLRIPRSINKEDIVVALRNAMLKAWTEISKTKLFKYKDIPMPLDIEVEE